MSDTSDTSATSFAGSDLPVRGDLVEAHERAWAAIREQAGINEFYRVRSGARGEA